MSIHKVTFILLVVGGLNWGLEAFGYGIGNYVSDIVAEIIYILVALSALYEVFTHKKNCKGCVPSGGAMQ
jgi:uncharacterized membrane protein YuzA (DUF378 family)